MKKLRCPQCDIHRFYVRNEQHDTVLVNVDENYNVIPINPLDSLEGFDLTTLYCLGCSWSGSPKRLKGGNHAKQY
ncbi:MAG: hypothetical protein WCG08_11210 [Paludibacter sp.]|jgi:hypothetical protein